MSLDTVKGPPLFPASGAAAQSLLAITPVAADRIRYLLAQKSPPPEALLISVTTKGCSGLSYDLQYLDRLADKPKFSDAITQHGVTVVIDPKASLYIIGSTMDYKESPTQSGFDFTNPNETGRCGCGESFTVG
jgi:iron-sulfur cluster assembly accessory protein